MYVRKLTKADVESYWPLRLRALKEHPDAFGSSYETSKNMPIEDVLARMADEDNKFIVGVFEDDDTLIGMGGFSQEINVKTKHKGMIWGMYSAAEHRGKGVGRAVMTAIIERVKQLPDVEQINLAVVSSNASAKGLYQSMGFNTYGVEKHALCVDGTYYDEDFMVLFLKK
jgi:RimJ/RimL family protein N-acetyltransferase